MRSPLSQRSPREGPQMRQFGSITVAWLTAILGVTSTASAQNDPFAAVFAIMDQPAAPDSKGCRGCHIGTDPVDGIEYWGNDQATVLQTLAEGPLVTDGRDSVFGVLLTDGSEPNGGIPWESGDLALMNAYLHQYDPPPDPTLFDPVFAIMNQDRGPTSMGCRGCHIGPAPMGPPYWGDDEEAVRAALDASEITTGGRMSAIAYRLQNGIMPFGGQYWRSEQLQPLFFWLRANYE